MANDPEPYLVIESDPDPEHARFLDDRIYEFGVQATGITDGKLLAVLLRGPDGKVVGGAYGWTWGGTCYIRHLFIPASMRGRGLGTRIMRTVEEERGHVDASRSCWRLTTFRPPASTASSASPSSGRSRGIRAGTGT